MLGTGARSFGWPNQLWTTRRVADVIRRKFGVSFHHDHVGRLLHRRLRWTPQKPRRQARERDEAAIAAWKATTFPAIAADARGRGTHLVFLDESGFMLSPTVRRTWAPVGRTPRLRCWDLRDRVSAISAVTVSPRSGRVNFYVTLLPDNSNAKAADIVAFLRMLRQHLGALAVTWDGSRIHSRSRLVKAFLARNPGVRAETLPGYAPELNPDEGVWGWTKYGRLANLAAADTAVLRARLDREFGTLKRRPWLLTSFIRETGLPLAA